MPAPGVSPDVLTVATRDRILVASELILDCLGLPELVLDSEFMLDGDPIVLVAKIPIGESNFTEVPGNALTILEISKPFGLLAISALWTHSIDYAMRSPSTRQVKLYSGLPPQGVVIDPSTNPYRSEPLVESAAKKIAKDLERLGLPLG